MQILRLLPEQIMRYWTQIRECLIIALPPFINGTDIALTYIQESLLLNTLQCWLVMSDDNTKNLYGIMTTNIVHDQISNCKNLLIYSITTIGSHPVDMWERAAIFMRQYAKAQGCYSIMAYSSSPEMLDISVRLGGNIETRLVTFIL